MNPTAMTARALWASIMLPCLALGCAYSDGGVGDPYVGVTPGGVQDIGYAREMVRRGQLPDATAITAEGLFSEHDLPVEGEPCASLLCLRPAFAVVPSLDGASTEYWLQVGLASGLSHLERPPMDLTILIDKSASMAGDMAETNQAAINMLRHLGVEDAVSVLTFDQQVREVHPHGPIEDLAALERDVAAIQADGGWDMDPALERAVAVQRAAVGDAPRLRRVVVLSCGYPDAQAGSGFSALLERAAADRIGFTFVGILLGYNADLADALGRTGGGSYHYVQDLESTAALFEEGFDLRVTPLAYDLNVELSHTGGRIAAMYGVPGVTPGEGPTKLIEIATAFPSERSGAIALRLDAPFEGSLTLSYRAEPSFGFDDGAEQVSVSPGVSDEAQFSTAGVRKIVALSRLAEELRAALREALVDRVRALERLDVLSTYLTAEAEALNDPDLRVEVTFVGDIAALIR
ncbi:MAG: VWA domain-containing protein [Sandaracinaceae bacterium]|jgi:Ca-activated chloride channel family protein|nr:VWA domain-containing protein [Sandaracinaceae bacterium]MBP7681522.1 VWA domain-containing protein [Deltaproteobacteria bacterium]MBK6808276.1 VWA domain-containing protein [Sandaracinaceae bacterium]MBK7151937.1 VWA domain-containing protein [Sandaracinaceae bacterium]MBK7779060.1 VWA domain-containing protein [Sandaracinaceae bacterium]